MRQHARKSLIHQRDLERFRPGLGGIARYFNDADWRTALPEDVRADPGLKDFKDVGSLAKSYLETKTFVGGSLRPPGPDAGEKDWAEFDKKLQERVPGTVRLPKDPEKRIAALREAGVLPKEAKDYDAAGVTFEAGAELSTEEVDALRARAAKYGLPKEQFKTLLQDTAAERATLVKGQREAHAALKQEWGAAYDERMGLARSAAEKVGAPQSVRDALAKGLVDKDTANMFVNLAKSLGVEGREIADQGHQPTPKLTKGEAQARIKEIQRRPEFNNPGQDRDEYKRLVDEYVRLQPFAYPEEAA